ALAVDPRVDDVAVADAWFLIRFYERRQFSPAWESDAKRDALLAALGRSVEHGLDPDDYHIARLREHRLGTSGEDRELEAIHFELLASDALARYAFHLRFGKVAPEALDPSWNFSRTLEGTSPIAVFERLVGADDVSPEVEALAPGEPRYVELKAALEAYRGIERAGGWPLLEGGALRPGMRDPRVAQLRERLRIEGYAAGQGADPELFDESLEAAVRSFQRLHGLDADGVVGARSVAALNVPVEARIDQLRVNLERLRWIFRDLEERYIVANIARFQVTLVEDGEPVWTTRAVVGRPYRQTPTFRAQMTYLVLNPTWTVPPGILRSDLLPE